MSRFLAGSAIALILVLSTSSAWAQNAGKEGFEPITLAQMTSELNKAVQDAPKSASRTNYLQDIAHVRRRVVATYTGQSRALTATDLAFIQQYADIMQKPAYGKIFARAYLFREGGRDYWLPVQAPVAEFFPKELKEGDDVTLYLLETGGAPQAQTWQWFFLVEDFRAPGR